MGNNTVNGSMVDIASTISFKAPSKEQGQRKLVAISTLLQNISTENLELLADKSKRPGINEKIQKYKHFI